MLLIIVKHYELLPVRKGALIKCKSLCQHGIILKMTSLNTVCGRTAWRLARSACSCKRFRTVPERLLLSPDIMPAVTVAG